MQTSEGKVYCCHTSDVMLSNFCTFKLILILTILILQTHSCVGATREFGNYKSPSHMIKPRLCGFYAKIYEPPKLRSMDKKKGCNSYNSWSNTVNQTLKLKLSVYTFNTPWLFHFKSVVVMYRAKKMKIVTLSKYIWTWLYVCAYVWERKRGREKHADEKQSIKLSRNRNLVYLFIHHLLVFICLF